MKTTLSIGLALMLVLASIRPALASDPFAHPDGIISVGDSEDIRTWTDTNGRQIQAKLLEIRHDTILIRMGYDEYEVPLTKFSDPDKSYVQKIKEAHFARLETARERARMEQRLERSLLKNGGFSSASGWSGGSRDKLDTDGAEKDVYRIDLRDNREVIVTQSFKPPADCFTANLEIVYSTSPDFETKRPDPGAITVRFRRTDRSSTFYERSIKRTPTGTSTLELSYGDLQSSPSFELEFTFHPGEGQIYLHYVFLDPVSQ